MPTLAIVAPPVPPQTISRAGMSMNAAGLVPSIIALRRIPNAATPMPTAVAGFIVVRSAGVANPSAGGLRAPDGGDRRLRGGVGGERLAGTLPARVGPRLP